MKITNKIKREFNFLCDVGNGQDFLEDTIKSKRKPKGVSALEAWAKLTTHGKIVDCCEPVEFDRARSGKIAINITIKMWAEDLAAGLLTRQEVDEMTETAPQWVSKAAINQAVKIIGFSPSYLTL